MSEENRLFSMTGDNNQINPIIRLSEIILRKSAFLERPLSIPYSIASDQEMHNLEQVHELLLNIEQAANEAENSISSLGLALRKEENRAGGILTNLAPVGTDFLFSNRMIPRVSEQNRLTSYDMYNNTRDRTIEGASIGLAIGSITTNALIAGLSAILGGAIGTFVGVIENVVEVSRIANQNWKKVDNDLALFRTEYQIERRYQMLASAGEQYFLFNQSALQLIRDIQSIQSEWDLSLGKGYFERQDYDKEQSYLSEYSDVMHSIYANAGDFYGGIESAIRNSQLEYERAVMSGNMEDLTDFLKDNNYLPDVQQSVLQNARFMHDLKVRAESNGFSAATFIQLLDMNKQNLAQINPAAAQTRLLDETILLFSKNLNEEFSQVVRYGQEWSQLVTYGEAETLEEFRNRLLLPEEMIPDSPVIQQVEIIYGPTGIQKTISSSISDVQITTMIPEGSEWMLDLPDPLLLPTEPFIHKIPSQTTIGMESGAFIGPALPPDELSVDSLSGYRSLNSSAIAQYDPQIIIDMAGEQEETDFSPLVQVVLETNEKMLTALEQMEGDLKSHVTRQTQQVSPYALMRALLSAQQVS